MSEPFRQEKWFRRFQLASGSRAWRWLPFAIGTLCLCLLMILWHTLAFEERRLSSQQLQGETQRNHQVAQQHVTTHVTIEHLGIVLPKLGILSGSILVVFLGLAVYLTLAARQRTRQLEENIAQYESVVQALHESEGRYRSLVDNLEQGVYLKDQNLRYLAANKWYCDELDCTEEQVVGKTDKELYAVAIAQKHVQHDRYVLERGETLDLEEVLVKGESKRRYRVIRTPVRDKQQEVVGVLGICWDVTEQRHREYQLQQSQKMEAVGQLAGGIAHDFNNLLTAVLGHLNRVLCKVENSSPIRDSLEVAQNASERAAGLVKQLLGFSRQTLLTSKPINLSCIVDEAIDILQHSIDPRISLEAATLEKPWSVEADPVQMSQVVLNLCINARDAMPQGGSIVLEVDNVVLGPEDIARNIDAHPGEFVRLSVQDTGTGIPPEVQARMFEPFYTTKELGKGTGLGLANVFGIVKQHHGWIECATAVGEGTRFEVYLPCCEREVPLPEDDDTLKPARYLPDDEANEPTDGARILLIDDELMIRTLAKAILEDAGHEVILAEDGQEGVDEYERQWPSIDLVLMDMTMPRLCGQDAFQKMLQINPDVRVIFASGYSDDALPEADRHKVEGFMSKPFTPTTLLNEVHAALARPKPETVETR